MRNFIGVRHEESIVVDESTAVTFLGHAGARVLGTPWMIMWMERTSRDAVKPLLPDGWDTVGTIVNVRHLSAAPMGICRGEIFGIGDLFDFDGGHHGTGGLGGTGVERGAVFTGRRAGTSRRGGDSGGGDGSAVASGGFVSGGKTSGGGGVGGIF